MAQPAATRPSVVCGGHAAATHKGRATTQKIKAQSPKRLLGPANLVDASVFKPAFAASRARYTSPPTPSSVLLRTTGAVFGDPYISPTKDEQGMESGRNAMAQACAALRKAPSSLPTVRVGSGSEVSTMRRAQPLSFRLPLAVLNSLLVFLARRRINKHCSVLYGKEILRAVADCTPKLLVLLQMCNATRFISQDSVEAISG